MLRKIISNTKWLAVYAVAGRASWLATLFFLAQTVGVSSYGELTFYLSFWVIANKFFGLGLDIWLNRHVASRKAEDLRSDVKRVALLRLTLVGGGFFLLGILSLGLAGDHFLAVGLFSIIGLRQIAESMREVAVGALQGLEKMRIQAEIMIPWDIFQLALVLFAAYVLHIENVGFLALFLLVAALGKVITLFAGLNRQLATRTIIPKALEKLSIKRVVAESKHIGMTMFTGVILGQSHILYMRLLTDAETVGAFGFAYLFVSVSLVGLGTVRQALFPTMSRLATVDTERFKRVFVNSLGAFFGVSVLIVVILKFFSTLALPKIMEPSFVKSVQMLTTVSWVIPAAALSAAMANSLIASGHAAQVLRVQLIGLLINQGLNFILISKFGWKGAFFAILLTFSLMVLQYWYLFMKRFKFTT